MEVTANAVQNVATNQNILFTETAVPGCQAIIHREGSGLITLRGLTNGQNRARFKIFFGANVGLPTGTTPVAPVVLAISVNGEPILTSSMISTPAAAGEFNSIAGSLYLNVPSGCCTQVSVENIGTTAAAVQNANFIIERVA